jgi:soluble lytic murein transglycosylase-like protein
MQILGRSGWFLLLILIGSGRVLAAPTEPPTPELRQRLIAATASSPQFPNRFAALTWYTSVGERLKRWLPDDRQRHEFLKHVLAESQRTKLEPELVLAVIEIESGFNRHAVSSAKAMGYMQIMPFWRKEIGRPSDNMLNLKLNLNYGCTILRYYIDMEKGNVERALQRYNGSYGRPHYSDLVLGAKRSHWFSLENK